MDPDDSGHKQISNYDGNTEGHSTSPDGGRILSAAQVKIARSTANKYPGLDKATGIIITDLMYKYWDEWATTAPHPSIIGFDGKLVTNIVDVLEGELYESSAKPRGGIEQLAWNMTSDRAVYTCRKKVGLACATSTNSGVYVYDLDTKETMNITGGMMSYDTNP